MNNESIYQQYMYSYPHKTAYRELNNIAFADVKSRIYEHKTHLYIHMPFCQSRCGFCNLFTCTGADNAFIDNYIEAIIVQARQMQLAPVDWASFTIGGGTPLLLNVGQLWRLFCGVFDELQVDTQIFKAIETSPSDTTAEKVALLRQLAVSRVSIGVQSFNDLELATLHRRHSAVNAHRALELLRRGNFPIINIDIIYGIPGQTAASLMASLNQALDYQPDELFLYPLYNMPRQPDMYSLYIEARDRLLHEGYTQTSMRRFVRVNNESTAESCGFENSLALGAGGRSYLGNLHYCTPWSQNQSASRQIVADFIARPDKTQIHHGYVLSQAEMKRRFIIKNLFFYKGLSLSDYQHQFFSEVLSDFPLLGDFIKQDYCHQQDNRILLTVQGLALSDQLGPQFISPEVHSLETHKR